MDPRTHLRNESIARRRQSVTYNKSPLSPGKLRPSANIGGNSNSPDAFEFLKMKRRRKNLIQAMIFGVLACIIIYLISNFYFENQLIEKIKERKFRLDGVGESWVLPHRYEQDAPLEELEECKRVMLFKFSDCCGFASEVNLLLTASVISNKLGYTLLADDSTGNWNYGSLQEYFLPKPIYCRPPRDWFVPEAAVEFGSSRWQSQDRVWFSRSLVNKASDWIKSETLDSTAMDELRGRKFGHILPEGQTLPDALEDIFIDYAAAAKELWRPNQILDAMIRGQRMELGLGSGGIRNRKNSPTFGGKKKKGGASRARVEDVEKHEDHDYDEAGGAERSDRGPIIASHVRPGDKLNEWTMDTMDMGIHDQSYGNLTVILEGAADAVRRLSSKSTTVAPGYTRGHPTLFPVTSKATFLVMTADNNIMASLAADPFASTFDVQRTSKPPLDGLRQWDELFKVDSRGELTPASIIMGSYSQKIFNELPLSLRIHLTRFFLRDLTVSSLYADAFVVTGSSNVGRLACLIAGEDAVVGPRSLSGSYGGRIRSIDTFWFPSPHIHDLY